ncbi:MAG: ABC transporter permease subunit [Clostridia bacterium]
MATLTTQKETTKRPNKFLKKLNQNKYLMILFAPCLIYYLVFKYAPMWGVIIAFYDYSPFLGLAGSDWIGLENFHTFFASPIAIRAIKNSIVLGLQMIAFGFPAPIVFALVLNEVSGMKTKKFVQTVSYMPHFLSAVVIVGLIQNFFSPINGIVNTIIVALGGTSFNFIESAAWFRPLFVGSDIWAQMGWGAIVYMAALTNIDPALYEAASIDGANRWQQMISITLPSLAPTIITMLLLRIGSILTVSLEKALLLQNAVTYSTSDLIDTLVYRTGIVSGNFSYATTIGLFNSVVCLILLIVSNFLANRFSDSGLF